MPDEKVTVNRSNISLREWEEVLSWTRHRMVWDATLDGHLSTGEEVHMSRSAESHPEALAELEAAIREQGWEIV